MEVILLERIEKLGQMGDVVSVKPGYARNYLLPKNKAMRATDANKSYFEEQRAQLEAADLERRSEAEKVGGELDGTVVVLVRQAGEGGQLYGSVTARDIAAAVTEAGFTITRQQVRLDKPIKTIGLHDVQVSLHAEVNVTVKANVARSTDEAEIQAKTGEAVVSEAEREAREAAEAAAETERLAAEAAEAEVAADEAAVEQAEALLEEGAAPETAAEEEAAGDDASGGGDDKTAEREAAADAGSEKPE